MYGTRKELFARTCLSNNEDIGIRSRTLAEQGKTGFHLRAVADDSLAPDRDRRLLCSLLVAVLQGLIETQSHGPVIALKHKVFPSTVAQGEFGGTRITFAGDDDHLGAARQLLKSG